MRPGSIVLAALTGLIWGVTAMVVIGVTLTLVTGDVAQPQATAAGLAGLVSALVLVWRQSTGSAGAMADRGLCAAVLFVVLMVASFAAPFGLSLGQHSLWQGLGLVMFVAGVTGW